MDIALLIAILSGLGAMLAWGTSDFFTKKVLDHISYVSSVFWVQVVGVILLLPLLLGRNELPNFNLITLVFIIGFGLFDALTDMLLFKGFAKGQVSILSPIFASYSGLVILLGALIFRETLPDTIILGLLIMLTGLILVQIIMLILQLI